MAIRLSTSLATSMATAVNTAIDAGAGAGTLKVYTGSKPASVETAASGTLLATFTLTDPAGSAASGVLTLDFDPDLSATVAADGTAGWFRIADSDGNGVVDGSVSATGSGGDLTFTSTSWTTGMTVTLTDGTVTQPTA